MTIEATIQTMLAQGADPTKFRKFLATRFSVSLEVVDAQIAQAGQPRTVSAAVVAEARLSAERSYARTHRAAWRAHNHEEE